jgi:hypothetical protein
VLNVQWDQQDYVVRQPIRVRVELKNVSSSEVRILEPRFLGPEMQYVTLRVITPDGRHERRVARWWYDSAMLHPGYMGEPLAPGQGVVFCFYPVAAFSVNEYGQAIADQCDGIAFCRPGQYQVAVEYEAPQVYELIWASGGGHAESDFTTITIRSGDKEETQILDALWGPDDSWPYLPETANWPHSRLEALRARVREYPDHPMTNYARLRLAGALGMDPSEQVQVLTDLSLRAPTFRRLEVGLMLSAAYLEQNENERARDVLSALRDSDPSLATSFQFMEKWLWARYGEVFAPRLDDPVAVWESRRRRGIAKPGEFEPSDLSPKSD